MVSIELGVGVGFDVQAKPSSWTFYLMHDAISLACIIDQSIRPAYKVARQVYIIYDHDDDITGSFLVNR